ncbi:hypothetical protein AGLY_002122 [Aphis glycines]|uniref:Uncharacterized protein n=1 Tax=Aphis glycines TaxID=307491 RepID=A0A6G0U672_APHGL|nr:hypothetical protein AGLY_002122 [Aphis glycines]
MEMENFKELLNKCNTQYEFVKICDLEQGKKYEVTCFENINTKFGKKISVILDKMVKERHLEKLLKSNYKWDMESFINNVKYYDSYDWFKEIEYLTKNCIFKKEYEEYETFLKINMYKYIEFCHLEQEKTYNVYKIITIIDAGFPVEIKLLVILDNMCYFILPDVFLDMLIDSGFPNTTFDFSILCNTLMYCPTSEEKYINIDKECEFTINKEDENSNSVYKIPIGIYSLDDLEEILNCNQNEHNNIKLGIN